MFWSSFHAFFVTANMFFPEERNAYIWNRWALEVPSFSESCAESCWLHTFHELSHSQWVLRHVILSHGTGDRLLPNNVTPTLPLLYSFLIYFAIQLISAIHPTLHLSLFFVCCLAITHPPSLHPIFTLTFDICHPLYLCVCVCACLSAFPPFRSIWRTQTKRMDPAHHQSSSSGPVHCFWALMTYGDLRFIYLSSSVQRAVSAKYKQLLGQSFFDYIHPDEAKLARKDLNAFMDVHNLYGSVTR